MRLNSKAEKPSSGAVGPRFWELDAFRGLCVIAMAAYHSFFCAHYIGLSAVDPYSGFLGISPLFIAGAFILISGMSVGVGSVPASTGGAGGFRRWAFRSLRIGICAAVITAVTLAAAGPESFVAFGILHCLALTGLILYPFRRFRWLNALIGAALALPGFLFLHGRAFPPFAWWFFPLGFRPEGYYPIDFVPLLPWSGFGFLGVFLASLLYAGGKRRFPWPFAGKSPPARILIWLGRKSLVIYVVHVPLILGILLLAKLAFGL